MVSHFNEPTGIKVHRFQWNVFGFNLPKRPPIDQASLGRRRFEKDLFKMLREGGFLLYIDCLVYVSNSRVTHARITHHPLKNLSLSLSQLFPSPFVAFIFMCCVQRGFGVVIRFFSSLRGVENERERTLLVASSPIGS